MCFIFLKSIELTLGETSIHSETLSLRATDRHLLELASGRTAWTLFIMGPQRQKWGFYTPHGKVLAEHYAAYKAATPDVRSMLVAGGVA